MSQRKYRQECIFGCCFNVITRIFNVRRQRERIEHNSFGRTAGTRCVAYDRECIEIGFCIVDAIGCNTIGETGCKGFLNSFVYVCEHAVAIGMHLHADQVDNAAKILDIVKLGCNIVTVKIPYNVLVDQQQTAIRQFGKVGYVLGQKIGQQGNDHSVVSYNRKVCDAPLCLATGAKSNFFTFCNTAFLEKNMHFLYFRCHITICESVGTVVCQCRTFPVGLD